MWTQKGDNNTAQNNRLMVKVTVSMGIHQSLFIIQKHQIKDIEPAKVKITLD